MCTCKPGPSGTIICDHCASQIIETLNGLLPQDREAQHLPTILTNGEYDGLKSAVNGWFDYLQSSNGQEAAQ